MHICLQALKAALIPHAKEIALSHLVKAKADSRRVLGLCPAHEERTPSFSVVISGTNAGRCKCFGCGAGMDLIDLYVTARKVDLRVALQELAGQFAPHLLDAAAVSTAPPKKLTPSLYETYPPAPNAAFIPRDFMEQTIGDYTHRRNSLFPLMVTRLGALQAEEVAKAYCVGTGYHKDRTAAIFWYIDIGGIVRYGKTMPYKTDGHAKPHPSGRGKYVGGIHSYLQAMEKDAAYEGRHLAGTPDWLGAYKGNMMSCLFGEHLLPAKPKATVAIVESEKTALLCAGIFADTDQVWVATGGKGLLKKERCSALAGRHIVLYPDLASTEEKEETPFQKWSRISIELVEFLGRDTSIEVSSDLERIADHYPHLREAKADYADCFEGLDVDAINKIKISTFRPAPTPQLIPPPSLPPARPRPLPPDLPWPGSPAPVCWHLEDLATRLIDLPAGRLNVPGMGQIADPARFASAHLAICQAQEGKPAYLPYLERMQAFVKHLQPQQEAATLTLVA